MSKKLQNNGLFESSRMMLPEHKEAYLLHQTQLIPRHRPLLDEQEAELLSHLITESTLTGSEITLVWFGELETRQITGYVAKIDQHKKAIKLTNSEGSQWIPIGEISTI